MTRTKDVIRLDLARGEQRLAELDRAREEARTRVEALRSELLTTSASPPTAPLLPLATDGATSRTSADKVKLFRSLFRGRADVFPTRFVSKKTGKAGYAPACSTKWEAGLCILKTGARARRSPPSATDSSSTTCRAAM